MTNIDHVTLEVTDAAAAERFYRDAFGLEGQVRFREGASPSSGFRGYTLSLTVAQPGDAEAFIASALNAGARTVVPPKKSLWGFGGIVEAPDGALWNIATSAKKDARPAERAFEHLVLLIGVEDVAASKRLYVERGLKVNKSIGSFVDFDMGDGIGFGLYKRRALAKSAGVPEEGSGSHRILIGGRGPAFTDPDGFVWEETREA
ncbi:VOC family protein [Leifsonia sp. F6_8S_P_1B]|uniref:VOC family protein n=1 Tax=Leifsonia williamsii TaxID=3035919 RepID=A0ABT8KBH9_9MICO|nr:VOC family protein [Leifsonia williamsii]MDN4614161.1 VOC family protein [Leifsonia williamsii]